jgi:hypothetical protein
VRVGPLPAENAAEYRQGATVRIETTGGQAVTNTVLMPKGAARLGVDWPHIEAKYRTLVPHAPIAVRKVETLQRSEICERQAMSRGWSKSCIEGASMAASSAVLMQNQTGAENLTTAVHPSAPVLPVLFALAEQRGMSGRDFVTAMVLGWPNAPRCRCPKRRPRFAGLAEHGCPVLLAIVCRGAPRSSGRYFSVTKDGSVPLSAKS